jgi:predicted AlkP superfamily phosphohydrolase/phosphomutase
MEAAFWRRRARKEKFRLFKMHENIGGVWMTTRDREGRVLEPKEHARLVALIGERLETLEWEGRGIMASVDSREELYRGPYLDRAPDLVFTLREDYGILEPGRGSAPGEMVVQAPADRPRKKGTHRRQGMFLLKGEGLKAGKLEDGADIADMTATALYLLDLPIPDDLDGVIPAGAFQEAFSRENPVRRGPAMSEGIRERERPFSEKEEAAVIERLRGIGYFD